MPRMISMDDSHRERMTAFLSQYWGSAFMAVRGFLLDMTRLPGILALEEDGSIAGALTYRIEDRVCEIISLNSAEQGRGIGAALLQKLTALARSAGCGKIILLTTNDNINAIRFYQRRGFDLVGFYPNAMERARKLKPDIPLLGDNDIPLRHELEFALSLED